MLALQMTHNDGQVTLVRAGWQLWDWACGGRARLWLIRAECGCADRNGKRESCLRHMEVVSYKVIQLATDGLPLEIENWISAESSTVLIK